MKRTLQVVRVKPASAVIFIALFGCIVAGALSAVAEERVASSASASAESKPSEVAAPDAGATPPAGASDSAASPSKSEAQNPTFTSGEPTSTASDATASEGNAANATTAEVASDGNVDSSVTPHYPTEKDAKAFPRHAFILTYDMAVPVGDTWRYIGAFSPSGCSFDYRYHFTPRLAVGALIGWNSFEIKEKGTFVYDIITVTGTQIRSMDAMYFGADVHLNLLPITAKIVPYIGVDLVAYHLWRATDFGWWSAAQSDWHFGFAPGVGVLFKLPGVTLILGSKFQMAVKTSDAPSETYVSFNLGVGLD